MRVPWLDLFLLLSLLCGMLVSEAPVCGANGGGDCEVPEEDNFDVCDKEDCTESYYDGECNVDEEDDYDDQEPMTISSSVLEDSDDDDDDDDDEKKDSCKLIYYDSFLIAGEDIPIHSPVGWEDVVIPFQQHDRRAFPLFHRFHYFYQLPNKPFHFLFAPTLNHPFECHNVYDNLKIMMDPPLDKSVKLNPPLVTTRAVRAGDPLYQTCRHPDHSSDVDIDDFPNAEDAVARGWCMDGLATGRSTLPGVELGAFATRDFAKAEHIMVGPLIHVHRSEFRNKQQDGTDEELLNYCYGHPDTDLLLLPAMPVVNSINHSPEPNVGIVPTLNWDHVFTGPTEIVFGASEISNLHVAYVALRDIKAGDEIFIHYGEEWMEAWEERDPSKPFRHEIHLTDFFPQDWLDEEVRDKPAPELKQPKLKPGQIDNIRLSTTGEIIGPYLHRVGFPDGFTEKMAKWADDIGVTATMEDYILNGKALQKNSETRVRINGGTWWIKRFDASWQSDMHYITPDDDESNEQYMVALSDAGFDTVLEGIGKHFNISRLSCFYPSYIAVSHASFSHMHSDSEHENLWNLIFPVHQVNSTEPEINLGANNADFTTDLALFNVPYQYEPDHGTLLGLNGMHGTAPTDYRGIDGDGRTQMRLVASVYMGAFDDDTFVDEYVENWHDPPYPRRENLRNALMHRTHWSAADPTKKVGSPQVNDVSSVL